MSSSKTYGFVIKNLADRYNNVKVTEQKAALKFLYDMRRAHGNPLFFAKRDLMSILMPILGPGRVRVAVS